MTNDTRGWTNFSVVPHPGHLSEERESNRSHSQLGSVLLVLLAAAAVNGMVSAKLNVPVIRPAAGFWFAFILPAYLIYTTSAWRGSNLEERLGYSVCAVLLALMLIGLAMSTILPLVGLQHPLGVGEVLVATDVLNCCLYIVRNRYPDRVRIRSLNFGLSREELRLLAMAAGSVALVILGANRLNNGASDQLTLAAFGLLALIILLSLRWLKLIRDAVLYVVIYLASLSLLLSTSLRGWFVTGHDIQEEYQVFQLTSAHARWSMAYFHDAYNACLSITIIPTELSRLISVDDPYVFKLFFQLIFAVCPVLIYGISRRYFNRLMSILAVTYFIGFPTFFTDMPFLNRQEIALLFVAAGVLAITNPSWSARRSQVILLLAGAGVELAHYSSMYVLIGTLAIAWLFRFVARLLNMVDGARLEANVHKGRWASDDRTAVTLSSVAVLTAIVVLWGGLATGTSSQVVSAAQSAVAGLGGNASSTRSGNVAI